GGAWLASSRLLFFDRHRLVELHLDEGLLLQMIDVATHPAALRELAAHGFTHLRERALATLVDRDELRDDELRNVGALRGSRDLERHDVARLLVAETSLIRLRQAVSRPRGQQARLFFARVIVVLLGERIERRACTPEPSDT